MIKNSFVFAISLLLSFTIYGQNISVHKVKPFSNSWHLVMEGGLTAGFTDYSTTGLNAKLVGGIEYYFDRGSAHTFGLKVFGGGQRISGEDDRLSINTKDGLREPLAPKFNTDMYILGMAGIYSFAIENKFFPYFQIGGSYLLWLNAKDANGVKLPGLQQRLYDRFSMVFDINLGMKIVVNEKVALSFSTGIHLTGTDYLDDIAAGKSNDFYFTTLVGASFAPFSAGDSDEDGILNEFDACPEEKEDFDGFEDDDGCPEYDNDFDGIPDTEDNCPLSAEDFDGFADSDGCADPDNDLDGIPDVSDECPNIAEDPDGFLDEDGCPDKDNDNDGIPDELDECPNKPETINGFEDQDGCPDQINVASINRITLLGDEIFYSNTSTIKPEAIARLNEVFQTINHYPDSKWRIEGHMDSQGTEQFIRRISFERAEAVKNHLVSLGISPDRFSLYGMSDDFPVGDNTNPEGRNKNRRLEIIREN